jgi:hypothetical protein
MNSVEHRINTSFLLHVALGFGTVGGLEVSHGVLGWSTYWM